MRTEREGTGREQGEEERKRSCEKRTNETSGKEGAPRAIKASYDSRKEWRRDPKGYFLIKLFPKKGEIGVRHLNYDREPLLDVYGRDAESIVQTIIREGLISSLQHAAYLGQELQKAETALKLGFSYTQDDPLPPGTIKKKPGGARRRTRAAPAQPSRCKARCSRSPRQPPSPG